MAVNGDVVAADQVQTIARKMASQGMLNSGNFFVAELDALQSHFEQTLSEMKSYALRAAPARRAARAIRSEAEYLKTMNNARFMAVLAGHISGNACPENTSVGLMYRHEKQLQVALDNVIEDTSHGITSKADPIPEHKGFAAFVKRHAFGIGFLVVSFIMSALALYISYSKK